MEEINDWNTDTIKEKLRQEADDYFNREIGNKNHVENASTWHSNLKKFSKYSVKSKILNL